MAAETLISIIDDDHSLQRALVRLIRSFGYGACGFGSAEEFIESGAVRTSTCVITDICLPGMSGIELKRLMGERGCSVPVIMITARTEPGLEDSALANGALCFLRKPVDAKFLAKCVERALQM